MSVRRRKIQERLKRQEHRAGVVKGLRNFGLGLERAVAIAQEAQRQGITKITPELTAQLIAAIDAHSAEAGK
jgi:hypothetical protein